MKKFYIFFLLVLLHSSTFSQSFETIFSSSFASYSEGTYIDKDVEGNVYTTGTFKSYDRPPYNLFGCIISRWSSDGSIIWEDTIRNITEIKATRDLSGNLIIAGSFTSKVTFKDISFEASQNTTFGFIAKYNSEGQCIYARNLYSLNPKSIILNNDGYIVTGINNSSTVVTLNNSKFEKTGYFLANFNSSNECIWGSETDGINYSYGSCLASGNDGSVYVAGFFSNEVQYEFTDGKVGLKGTYSNSFLLKYNSNGKIQWAEKFSTTPNSDLTSIIRGIALDNDNLYVAGYYDRSLTFSNITLSHDNTSYASFIVKYDSEGKLIKYKALEAGSNNVKILDIKVANGVKYTTGCFSNSVDFGGKIGNTNNNSTQLFIARYNDNFEAEWLMNSVVSNNDENSSASAQYLNIIDENIFVTGTTSGSVKFDGMQHTSKAYNDMISLSIKNNVTAEVPSSINTTGLESDLNIYPNPSSGVIKFESKIESNITFEVSVSNISGNIVFKKLVSSNDTLYLNQLPKGVYFIDIIRNNKKATKKIIIQ